MDSIATRVKSRRSGKPLQLTVTVTQEPQPKPQPKKDPKDLLIESLRLAHQAAEAEAAALRQHLRHAGVIWGLTRLREFGEVRFSDGVKRFVNVRGDCVNEKGDYIGHFWWHTRRMGACTLPQDWEELKSEPIRLYHK